MLPYGWKSVMLSHHLAILVAIGYVQSGDMKYLNCHVTSQSLVIEGSCNFTIGNLLHFTTLPSLVAISVVIVYLFSLSRDLARSCD